jgi:alpha-mannosidase
MRFYEDVPLFWDAWDVEIYHLEKTWLAGKGSCSIVENGPLRVVLKVIHPLSKTSTLEQRIIICADSALITLENELAWNENRKILKVEFPLLIKNDFATYETQFGFIQRPTLFNNSWDIAKFEVCGHKFVDYSEFGYGVALLNDCKYGFSVKDNVLRMSIIRAPKSPDETCDIGRHTFKYALLPHVGMFQESNVVSAAFDFNVPLEAKLCSASMLENIKGSLFDIDKKNVILDTVKMAEDATGMIIVRLYEAYGGRGIVKLSSSFTMNSVNICNILEEKGQTVEVQHNAVYLKFTPFQILTCMISLSK